jgi:hypothetical protein
MDEDPDVAGEEEHGESLRDRLAARGEEALGRIAASGEEALGRIAQDLLENPWVNSALTAAFEARGKASQVQEVTMDFLNLPSAAHIERLTRRVRSISQRMEAVEDALTRLEDGLRGTPAALSGRLDSIEEQLADVTRLLGELQDRSDGVSPDQEQLRVADDENAPAGAPPA